MRKRYLFAVSMMLFFLSTLVMSNNVLAGCSDYRDFVCTEIYTNLEGQFASMNEEVCLSLCNDPGDRYLEASGFKCNLGVVSSKNMVGSGSFIPGTDNMGCYVKFLGRSMIAYLRVGAPNNSMVKYKCINKPCPLPSDRRLKKFIKEVKGIYNQIGLKMYRWQWTKKAEKLFGLKGYSAGVIAQEVKEKYPDAVVEYKGYLKVRYDYLDRLLLMQD